MNRLLTLCVFSTLLATVLTTDRKSVNLALETSILFEPKEIYKHLEFIEGARKFLDKLELALIPPSHRENLRSNPVPTTQNKYSLTAFLNDLVETILNFHEEEIEYVFSILESEMRTHFYKGAIFMEIVRSPKLQGHLKNKLKEWANMDPRQIRAKLTKYISNDVHKNTTLNRFGVFLNDFYDVEVGKKMAEILEHLKSGEFNELGNIIRDALSDLVFKHFDKMNHTTRAQIVEEVDKLSNYFEDKHDDDKEKYFFRRFLKNLDVKVNDDTGGNRVILDKNIEINVTRFDGSNERYNDKDTMISSDDISKDNDVFWETTAGDA